MLHRYWFTFSPAKDSRLPSALRLGCGVTAFSCEDAISLIQEHLLGGERIPPQHEVVEDVDVSTLDAGHVLPNMESPVWRGIWFPKGH
jgi:hypothetical protein